MLIPLSCSPSLHPCPCPPRPEAPRRPAANPLAASARCCRPVTGRRCLRRQNGGFGAASLGGSGLGRCRFCVAIATRCCSQQALPPTHSPTANPLPNRSRIAASRGAVRHLLVLLPIPIAYPKIPVSESVVAGISGGFRWVWGMRFIPNMRGWLRGALLVGLAMGIWSRRRALPPVAARRALRRPQNRAGPQRGRGPGADGPRAPPACKPAIGRPIEGPPAQLPKQSAPYTPAAWWSQACWRGRARCGRRCGRPTFPGARSTRQAAVSF